MGILDYTVFYKYEKVRRSGVYNMITEASYAAKAAGLTPSIYIDVIKRYSIIKSSIEKKYGSIDKFMEEF